MTTLTKKPNRATQITGGFYRKFNNLDNVKNTVSGSYAISASTITGKSGDHPTPSTVSVSDFRFNIPSNAVVKRITVHYRHAKRGLCNGHICTKAANVCNIPGPRISIWEASSSGGGSSSIGEVKGTAPLKDYGKHQTVVFNGLWDAGVVNNSRFSVDLEYSSNTNKHPGYVLLTYVYVSLDYFVPVFSVSVGSANSDKVYNNGEYHLRVSLSDANLTGRSGNVNISVPLGWSYKDFKGNGNVVKVSNQSLVWYPDMPKGTGYSSFQQSASAAFVELVFDVSVSFASGSDSYTGQFSAFLTGSSSPVTHNAVVYKPIPVQEEEATGTVSSEVNYDTAEKLRETKQIRLGENYDIIMEFNYEDIRDGVFVFSLYINETLSVAMSSNRVLLYINEKRIFPNIRQKTEGYNYYFDNSISMLYILPEYFENEDTITLRIRPQTSSVYRVFLGYYKQSKKQFSVENVYLIIIPQELSTPFLTLMRLSEEEINRLGSGYNYIVQSNMLLSSSEWHIRDWYKNFRMGVFNNKIEANCSTYYQSSSTEETFTGEIRLSSLYDITDAYLTVESDNPLTLTIGETEYNITSTPSNIPLDEEYILAVRYDKVSDDNCKLTIKQYDSNDELKDTFDYRIGFNAEEDILLREVEVDSTDYTTLTKNEIFTNAEYWSDNIAGLNSMNEVTALFTYNKDYPLYILITGDYPEGAPTQNSIQYLEPCIIEEDEYEQRLQNGQYPVPIENTITYEDSSEIVLDAYNISDTIVFYDLPLDDNYGTDTEKAIRGIELVGNIEQSDRLTLYAKLKSPNGESRQRSIIINDYDTNLDSNNKFHIGGNGDLWGFNTLEITHLEDWEIEFSISNNLEETSSSINFNKIQLILYIETVTPQNITAYINGEDIRYYGVFLTDVNIPEGLQTETDYLKVDGTDTNDAYRQNITSKEITLEFDLGEDCNLEANTLSRREFAKLLVNDRDEYNRPIPKRIEFSHYPDVYWEYIMEEAIEDKIEIGSYTDGKVKLTIPSGTSYDKETTVTSNTGYVNGLATINPVIYVRPTDEVITVRETVSGQEFHIGYSGGWENKILEIDCINKNIWLLENEEDNEPTLLNKYVDWNSSWFRLKGEYSFVGINCIVREVSYQERW